jgi:hypothetical protein
VGRRLFETFVTPEKGVKHRPMDLRGAQDAGNYAYSHVGANFGYSTLFLRAGSFAAAFASIGRDSIAEKFGTRCAINGSLLVPGDAGQSSHLCAGVGPRRSHHVGELRAGVPDLACARHTYQSRSAIRVCRS